MSDHDHDVVDLWVDLPGGGRLQLMSAEEVGLFEESRDAYIKDYHLDARNDLATVGAIITQELVRYRAQQRLTGIEPELNPDGSPTGRYQRKAMKPADLQQAQTIITKSTEQIVELEHRLGIDKRTRDQGGAQNVAGYVEALKGAAREYGVHILGRVKAYESVCMDARTKLRVLRNADPEDRNYEDVSEEAICRWLEGELEKLEDLDEEFAKEKGRLWAGRL